MGALCYMDANTGVGFEKIDSGKRCRKGANKDVAD